MKTGNRLLVKLLLVLGMVVMTTGPALADQIRIGYQRSWPASSLTARIAAQIIQSELDREVTLVPVAVAAMYKRVANGRLDAHLSAWLPTTHEEYYSNLWPQLVNLGPNLMGTRLGIAVPAYADVNSIPELKERAGDFDHKIIGIDSGAGININTKKAIQAYDLGVHLVPSSTAAMGAALKKAIDRHALIAVTGWTPLWIWQRFDLKLLDDPKGIYGTGDHVDTVASPALWNKAPAVFEFLQRFMLSTDAINAMELQIRNGATEDAVVALFVQNHPQKVAAWTHGLTR